MKQPTILVTETDAERKLDFAHSGLCFIRDWNLGWFEIPLSMKEEFEERFDIKLSLSMENSVCPCGITIADIDRINRNNWLEAFWNKKPDANAARKYIAEVKGSSNSNFFTKLTDTNDKIIGGASSWRQFEDIVQELKAKAKKDGYKDIEILMTFVM